MLWAIYCRRDLEKFNQAILKGKLLYGDDGKGGLMSNESNCS